MCGRVVWWSWLLVVGGWGGDTGGCGRVNHSRDGWWYD